MCLIAIVYTIEIFCEITEKTRTNEILKKLFSSLSETVERKRETNSETTQPNQLHLVTSGGTQFSHSDLIKCIGELQETLFDFVLFLFLYLSLSSFPSCLILINPSLQKYMTVFPLISHNQPIFPSPTLCDHSLLMQLCPVSQFQTSLRL